MPLPTEPDALHTPETLRLAESLRAVIAGLRATAAGLGRALETPPPRDTAAIAAGLMEATRLGRAFFALHPRLMASLATEQQAHWTAQGGPPPQDWYRLQNEFEAARLSMNALPRLRELVQAQAAPPRRPLLPDPAARAAALHTHHAATDTLLDRLHALITTAQQEDAAAGAGCRGDEPLPMSRFVALAHAAFRAHLARRAGPGPIRFLDVGCGAGLKLMCAERFFDTCHGIELDPGVAQAARGLLAAAQADRCTILEGDARDFESYDRFDVVYLYEPMRQAGATAELERHVAARMSPGALLIAPNRAFAARAADLGLAQVAGDLWQAGVSRRAALALRHAAERTGLDIPAPAGPLPGLWAPVLAASRANGFDPII
jgi:SAM-dependent methyltransferase